MPAPLPAHHPKAQKRKAKHRLRAAQPQRAVLPPPRPLLQPPRRKKIKHGPGEKALLFDGQSVGNGTVQQLDRLRLEHSISANDTPQRLAAAVIIDMPVGRKQRIGGNMNRALDAVVGGWSIATMITEQSGQPMAIGMASGRLANGGQRPNVVCPQLRTGLSMNDVALTWQNSSPASFLNASCFADPGDQNPGNAPRYFSGLRVDGIHNMDLNLYKSFVPKEGMKLDVRAEMFNFTNHPRFGQPNSGVGDPYFGTISGDAGGYTPRAFQFGLRFEF